MKLCDTFIKKIPLLCKLLCEWHLFLAAWHLMHEKLCQRDKRTMEEVKHAYARERHTSKGNQYLQEV